MSQLEETLDLQLTALKITGWEREHRLFAHHVGLGPGIKNRLTSAGLRDWRIDFAFPAIKFAVEVEGGGWSGGRHTRGSGFAGDLQKYHAAMDLGWNIYRCDGAMVRSGQAAELIEKLVKQLS